jgi:thiol-disulfide isomerase/thioredoxin
MTHHNLKTSPLKRTIGLSFMFCFLLSALHSQAQDSIVVKGQFIGNTKYAQVQMKKFEVGSFTIAVAKIKDEKFLMTLPPDIPAGVYRFQYAFSQSQQYLDIIINGKDKEINFTIDAFNDVAFPKFSKSNENQQWYAYLEQTSNQLQRIELLNQFINAYPNANAKVVQAAQQEWQEEKALYYKNYNVFTTKMDNTLACQMVANTPYYFTNPKDDFILQDYYKHEHFWDGFDATNPALLNTPLYTEHILNYLRYWMNPQMGFTQEKQTEGFKKAVDTILAQFSGHEQTKEFAYKYLTKGFKEIGQEEVLQYLDENYQALAAQCFDDLEKTELEKRMQGYAAMKIGNKAPDFELNITKGSSKAKRLYQVEAEKTLVVFWSSTCPHCLEEMPKLNEWAAKNKDTKVLAVSIDTDQALHKETIAQFTNLLHTCNYKGWDTEAASRYYIVGTPTFVLLDKDKNIIGKYSSFKQVEGVE